MQALMIKFSVAYLIFLYSIAYTVSALAANNSIYLTQSGSSALTLNITQTGGGNVVGTSNASATLSGNSMTVDLDQIGTGNTLAATVAQANSSSFTLRSTGDTNASTLTVGGTGDTAGSDFDFAATGDSNVLLYTQGASATSTNSNTDLVVTGTSNNLNITTEVVGATNNIEIDGSSKDLDSRQTGNANHSLPLDLTGSSNNIDVDQTNASGSISGIVDVVAVTTSGIIDIDQN